MTPHRVASTFAGWTVVLGIIALSRASSVAVGVGGMKNRAHVDATDGRGDPAIVTRGTISLKGTSPGPTLLLPTFQVGARTEPQTSRSWIPQ